MNNFDLTKYLAEGKLFEEDFKNPILDKYLELKKSIDYKTVFPTDLQSFIDSLDNTEREGLERDLAEGKKEAKSEKTINEGALGALFGAFTLFYLWKKGELSFGGAKIEDVEEYEDLPDELQQKVTDDEFESIKNNTDLI